MYSIELSDNKFNEQSERNDLNPASSKALCTIIMVQA